MNLSKRQSEAVEYKGGPLLIVAGAGSGKTRTLTSRIVAYLKAGIPAQRIIAITFTNKAAQEMKDRIAAVTSSTTSINGMFVGTFHSFGAHILRPTCRHLSRTSAFSIFDKSDSLRLIRRILKGTADVPRNYGPIFFVKQISALKNNVRADMEIVPSATKDEERLATLVTHVFRAYEQALADNNAFDFDDLIEKPVRLFQEHPDILRTYRHRFRHVFVDEYQDINTAQYMLIALLASEGRDPPSRERFGGTSLSVVGDDAQAIYSFRGADFRNFLSFENDWPGAKTIVLEQNYRSTGNIINAASALIACNTVQKQKTLWTESGDGAPISILETRDEEEEARTIGKRIQALRANGTHDIAILYRTNAQSRSLEQECILTNIPYHIFGGLTFYERAEIKDIIAALTIAYNPQDSLSRERIEKRIPRYRRKQIVEELPHMGSQTPVELIAYFIKTTEYPAYLAQQYDNSKERLENIAELVSFAGTFSSLDAFLERVSLLDASLNPASRKGSGIPVRLSTIHLAKGLEFDAVFVVGCTEGILPHQNSFLSTEGVEEERRLMYVAMTRAKQQLTLSFTDLPSRFLSEIPSQYANFEGASEDTQERSLDDEERYIVYE